MPAHSIEPAQAARRHYATPRGRVERLAQIDAEMDETGAQIDTLVRSGQPVPHRLRAELRRLGNLRQRYLYGGQS